jgi:TolB protein
MNIIKYVLTLLVFFSSSLAAVDAELDIIRKNSIIPKIAVVPSGNENLELVNKIAKVIQNDFSVSGHFKGITLEKPTIDPNNINYNDTNLKALDLILAVSLKKGINNYIVETQLIDMNLKEIRFSNKYSISNINRYPFLAHKIAIKTNNFLNAPSIDWMDRFVIFSRYLSAKKSEIVVADYTLTYQKIVVKGGLNIFPKWANEEQSSFYYTTYEGLYPTLVKQNLYSTKSQKLLKSDGMIVCSDVSKDGKNLLLTMAPNGQPDIYLYNVTTKLKTRITNFSGIDVGGNFVENDTKVVFVSDRLGKANIFAKKIGESSVERLVYHGKNNSQSTTYKDYIIYSSRETTNEFGYNTFNLYLISTKSEAIRRLTTQGVNQFPKFSTDGESLLYIKNHNGKSYLGIIRLNYSKSFLFALKSGKLQSIDW